MKRHTNSAPGRRSLLCIALLLSALIVISSCPNPIDEELAILVEDDLPPSISISEPTNYDTFRSSITLSGQVSDSSFASGDNKGKVSRLSYLIQDHTSFAGDLSFAADGSFSQDISLAGLTDRKILLVTAVDWNSNSEVRSIILDENTSGPYLTIASPANYSFYSSQVSVSGLASNSETDTDYSWLETITWELSGRPDMTETLTFNEDGTLSKNPADASLDYDSGTRTYSFNFLTYSLSEELYVMVTTTDRGGHPNQKVLTLRDDKPGPYLTVSSPSDNDYYHNPVTVIGTVQNSASDSQLNWVDRLELYVLGYTGLTKKIDFNPDPLIPPVYTPADGTASFNPIGNTFTFTLDTTGLDDSFLNISLVATDVGSTPTTSEISLKLDDRGPDISLTSPAAGGSYTGTLLVSGTVRNWPGAADAQEVDSLSYIFDTLSGTITFNATTGVFSKTLTTDVFSGPKILELTAEDDNGSTSELSRPVDDGLPPSISLDAVPGGEYPESLAVSGTVEDYDGSGTASTVVSVSYVIGSLNGTLVRSGTSFSGIIDTSGLTGAQILVVRAQDIYSNQGQVSAPLTDGIAPVLSITTPAANADYSGAVNVTGSVKSSSDSPDAGDVASLTYSIGGLSGDISYSGDGTIDAVLNLGALSGDQTLTITAGDASGNEDAQTIALKDGVPPVLSITSPVAGGSYGDSLTVAGTVLDYAGATGAEDVDHIDYTLGGLSGTLSFNSDGSIKATSGGNPIDTTSLSGDRTLTLTATDSDNNVSDALTIELVHE